ncbi:hypothetical protein [Streptomyces sp. L2]|uniref:hypothetical protein n=1 Tax=Streptomyces sp. L2 TaxID=2162665 RepID=UPI00101192BB|nr:hypothetical protein [Streptomyces sp. L2]
MTRRTDRRQGVTAAGPSAPTHTVAVVVPEPADAVPLVGLQPPGAQIAAVCLGEGTKDTRAALDRALAEATTRGCRVLGGVRVLGTGPGDAVAALLGELRAIGPHRLHTLDPDPAHVAVDETGVPSHGVPRAHARSAEQALAAARAWQRETGRPLFVDCHRAGADPGLGAAACRRYPDPVNWLSAGFDGRLTAFASTAGGVVRWWQEEPDRWRGPETVEGPGLLPGLCVVPDPHGFPHLFGLRRTVRADGGADVEVVQAAQYRVGRPLTPWLALGGPNSAAREKGREVGFPTAAFDTAGNLFVFVRNFGHSISYRCRSADGTWAAWRHLGGVRVADDLLAVTSGDGRVEVFARARDSAAVVRWYQGANGAWAEDRTVPFAARPGTWAPAAEPGAVLFRDARTGEASVWHPGAPGPCPLGEAEGSGPLAMARHVEVDGWPYSVLVRPGPGGTCSVGAHPEGRPDLGVWWQDLAAPSYRGPAAAVSRDGRLALGAWTAGDGPVVAFRREPEGGLAFGDWRPTGG